MKTVEEILKAVPTDEDALRCKCSLLIEQSKFDDALRLLSSGALEHSMAFEKAYCLYRLGRLQDALSVLSQVSASSQQVARLQLQAQLHYRMGSPKEAIKQYSQLFQQYGADGMEVRTNVLAAYVAGGKAAEVPAVMEAMKMSAQDSFEVSFNAACALLEAGSLGEAERQLQLAQRLGEEALYEEDLAEDEVALELAPVTAQLAYVAARLGRSDDAIAACQALLALPLDDDATAAVATANLCALLVGRGPADKRVAGECFKKLEGFVERGGGTAKLKRSLETRLGATQREALLYDYAVLALMAGKLEAAKDGIRALERQPSPPAALPLLQAAQLVADRKLAEASALLAAAGTGQALAPALMRVQLAALAGDAQQALQLLRDLPGVQSRPGVVATQAALMEQAGDIQGAASLLSAALTQHAQQQAGAGAGARRWLLSRLAALELRRGGLQEARRHLEQLMAGEGAGDAETAELLPRYARLTALCTPAAAPALAAALPTVAPAGGVPLQEVDALENASVSLAASGGGRRGCAAAGVPVPASQKKRGAGGEGEEVAKQKKRRKRRKRLPKGYDPANPPPPPDPERWLPKWERSDAKRKHKKKQREKEAAKGSQGAGKVDESLDRTHATDDGGKAAAGGSKPTLPARPAGGKGKKGGKGRR